MTGVLLRDLDTRASDMAAAVESLPKWASVSIALVGCFLIAVMLIIWTTIAVVIAGSRGSEFAIVLGMFMLGLVGMAVASFYCYRYLSQRISAPIERRQRRVLAAQYKKHWQDRLFRFFESSGMYVEEWLQMINIIGHEGHYPLVISLLHQTLPHDRAASVYAAAQRLKT